MDEKKQREEKRFDSMVQQTGGVFMDFELPSAQLVIGARDAAEFMFIFQQMMAYSPVLRKMLEIPMEEKKNG